MPKKAKRFVASEDELFAPCRKCDFNDVPLMRKRLSKIATSDIAYKAVARLLFFLTSRLEDRISAETIATRILDNENHFSDEPMDGKTIKRFADRETRRPENSDNYFDYFRFVAILIRQDSALSENSFIREVLSEFDVVSWYEATRDKSEADFEKYFDEKTRSPNAERQTFYGEMLKELNIDPDMQGETRMQVMGRSVSAKSEVFYSFRYTSEPSQISCSRVVVDAPDGIFPILTYTTTNQREVHGGSQSHNSSGFVFGFDSSIVFFGRVKTGAGFECLMIPRPPIEVGGRLHGVVLTPDITEGRPPIASRIVLIRERKIAEDLLKTIRVGLVPAESLPRELFGGAAAEILGNNVAVSLIEEMQVAGEKVVTLSDLVAAIDRKLNSRLAGNAWPFTTAHSRQSINPIRLLKYDGALTSFKPDDAKKSDT